MSAHYQPPAVRYPFDRPRRAAPALAGAWVLVAGALLAWAAQPPAQAARWLAALALLALAAWLLWRQYRRWPRGLLQWDGSAWALLDPQGQERAAGVALQVGLDGGGWLWVRARSAHRRHCLWPRESWLLLAARDSPQLWGDLRRAVYSSALPLAVQQ